MAETRGDKLEDEVTRLKALLRRWLATDEHENYTALLAATRAALAVPERRKMQRRKNSPDAGRAASFKRIATTDRRKGAQ